MQVFEVIAIKKDEKGRPSSIIFGPEALIASDEQSAILSATVKNNDKLSDLNMSEVEVKVRPFK